MIVKKSPLISIKSFKVKCAFVKVICFFLTVRITNVLIYKAVHLTKLQKIFFRYFDNVLKIIFLSSMFEIKTLKKCFIPFIFHSLFKTMSINSFS